MLAAIRWSQAAWTLALLLQLLLAGPGGCLSHQELFPFGPGHGDLELEAGDDLVSPALELSTALRFFDKSNIHSIYVSATPGGRWEQSGGRAWKAEAASEGRPRRAGGANEAGRTWASWAGTARPASLWGAGCGARFPSPRGLSASAGPPTPPRSLFAVARGALRSGELAPSAPPRVRPVSLQDPATPHSGTRAEFPLPRLWAAAPAGKPVRVLSLPSAFEGKEMVWLGPGVGQRPELGRSWRAGPGTPVGAGAGKDRQSRLSAPGEFNRQPVHLCMWTPDMSWQ